MKGKALALLVQRADELCAERGAKLTPQRKFVLQVLCAADSPLSAYQLLEQMGTVVDNPAPPTVYRALEFLLEHGLIHRLESLNAYVGCSHPEHPNASQFLICEDCGDVAEVEDSAVSQSLRAAEQAFGFKTNRPVVELLGTCAQCIAK